MSGSKNVTIPAEIADAIEYLRSCHVWDDALIGNCFNGTYFESKCSTRRLLANYAVGNPAKIVNAIINGYEREMTAEQRAHNLFRDKHDYYLGNGGHGKTFVDGMRYAINILGIKIEGVNV